MTSLLYLLSPHQLSNRIPIHHRLIFLYFNSFEFIELLKKSRMKTSFFLAPPLSEISQCDISQCHINYFLHFVRCQLSQFFEFSNICIDDIMGYKTIYDTLSVDSPLKLERIKTPKKQICKVIMQHSITYSRHCIFNPRF